jgi:hypothetical protein
MNQICIFLLAALTTLSATHAYSEEQKRKCKDFEGYVTAVLVDVSDPLNTPQRLTFEKLAERLIKEAPGRSRLDIYKISGSNDEALLPIISACKPAPSFDNTLLSGQNFWAKKQYNEFEQPLRERFLKLATVTNPGKESPILESLFSMSLRSFFQPDTSKEIRGKVIIISDFMQHSSLLSFYQAHSTYKAWRNSTDGRSWVKKFDRISVEAVIIPRSGSSALPVSGRDFFVSYFQDNFDSLIWRDLSASLRN